MKRNAIPSGTVWLQLICADMSRLLSALNAQDIPLIYVRQVDELTASFCIPWSHYRQAVQLIERAGGEIVFRRSTPGNLFLRRLIRRPVLIFGAILVLVFTFYLPSKILFVKVNGNKLVADRQIIDAVTECGIYFGADRHEVRSEKVKNQLLSKIPELNWVGVNTRGCVAEISVRERASSEPDQKQPIVTSLVAARDGVIREMTVTSGNPICRVGQAVKKGDLLVSGYSDCGRCIYGTKANAEIYAQTHHLLNVSALSEGLKREPKGRTIKKIGLIIGKKRINFYKGSGISDTTCVRMYDEYLITLPGGFRLPIALTVEEQIDYDTTSAQVIPEETEQIMAQYAQSYLESQMIAGKVEQREYQIEDAEGALRLSGQYICDEMIGQTRSEEIIKQYEQTD